MNIPGTIGTVVAIRNIKGHGGSGKLLPPKKEDKKIIWIIYKYMDNNENNAIMRKFNSLEFELCWKISDKINLTLVRMIRADLIQLKKDKEELVEWVNQSYQYSGFIGMNDFMSKLTLQEVEDIFNIKYVSIFKRILLKFKIGKF